MFWSISRCSNLSKDELRKLKEGEIITGEDGKRYRAHKSMLPEGQTGGPHGIGDPEDRSLRKIEADVLIPNMMNKQIEKTECRPEYELLVACMRREGGAFGLRRCKEALGVFNACKLKLFNDPLFRQKITDKYLEDRRDARRTGLTPKERMLEEYRQWKKDNPQD